MKILGIECHGITMPNSIQSREARLRCVQGVVAQAALYTILRNPNGNRYVLYLYWNGGKWNWNYNWLDNDHGVGNPSAGLANLFISLQSIFFFGWRVLFCKLPVPSAEHFASLIQLYGKSDVFFIIQRFCFPKHQEKHAKSIRFLDRETNVRMFLPGREKTGGRYCFYYFYKQSVDTLTERMTMGLG
jgi:hypothetical protein